MTVDQSTSQQHLLALFKQERQPLPWPEASPALNLLVWADEQDLVSDGPWLRAVLDAATKAETSDPQAMPSRLEQTQGLQQAKTLREAATKLLQHLADLIPPGTSPA